MRIASLFALAGLGLSTQAFAAPTFSVSGSCGGATTAVTDATNYRLVFGEAGAYTILGGSCADTELGVIGSASAPMSDSETTFVLTETHCGASAQVIDMDTCEVSAVVVLPTEDAYDMGYEDGCVFAGGMWDADTESCLEATCAYTDSDEDTYDDGSYAAGVASVDITTDNADCGWVSGEYWDGTSCLTLDLVVDVSPADGHDDDSFAAGTASVTVPDGSTYCGTNTSYTDGSCVSTVDITSDNADVCEDAGGTFADGACTFESGTACLSADDPESAGSRVAEVFSTVAGFAALKTDGRVVT
jgi:hypothetical protein